MLSIPGIGKPGIIASKFSLFRNANAESAESIVIIKKSRDSSRNSLPMSMKSFSSSTSRPGGQMALYDVYFLVVPVHTCLYCRSNTNTLITLVRKANDFWGSPNEQRINIYSGNNQIFFSVLLLNPPYSSFHSNFSIRPITNSLAPSVSVASFAIVISTTSPTLISALKNYRQIKFCHLLSSPDIRR